MLLLILFGLIAPYLPRSITFWLILLLGALVYIYFTIKRKHTLWKEKGIKYAEPTLLLGNTPLVPRRNFIDVIADLYKQFPNERYSGMYQFLQPALIIRDPDLIKQITIKEFDHFVDHRTVAPPDVDPLWGNNLFASKGQRWRELRTTLSPSFTSSKMRIMFQLIDQCAQQFVNYFKNLPSSELIELEMKDTCTRFTNDVIATTAFGLKCNSLQDKTNDFYLMGKEVSDFGGWKILRFFVYSFSPTLAKILKVKIVPTKIANYFSNIIRETVKTREDNHIIRPDMINLLMEASKGHHHEQHQDPKISEGFSSVDESHPVKNHKGDITIDDIIAQALIFFLAGFETVSVNLTFLFYELALNPDIQDRLREEINAISGEITYEKLLSMKYLDMVVSEVLRKWPAASMTDRQVTKAFTIEPRQPGEKPLHLEEGLSVVLPIFGIHRDEKYYPNPEKFDPERFSDENKSKINPATYLPFGSGPRNCIGSRFALLESKILMFHMLKNFKVVPVEKTPIPFVLDPRQVNMTAKGGMWLGFQKIL